MEKTRFLPISFIVIFSLLVGCGDNGSGPDLTPQITSIDPAFGGAGTIVTITGSDFSNVPSENTVSFNGTTADVSFVTSSQLETTVPGGATTGPVRVTVAGQTAIGPTFTVDSRQAFEGRYQAENYDLVIGNASGGTVDTTIAVEGGSQLKIGLVENSKNKIKVDVEDFLVESINTADVAFGGSGGAVIDFEEVPIAEVTGNQFELVDTNFKLLGGSETAPGEFSGTGILENSTLVFVFEYFIQGTSVVIFSGEVELIKL